VAEEVTDYPADDAGVHGRPHPPGTTALLTTRHGLHPARAWLNLDGHPVTSSSD
jgi:hypothetical protein